MDFNPNKPAQTKTFHWATYVPDRTPKFKMYSNRGHALNAFHGGWQNDAILYRWDKEKEEWEEIFRIEDFLKIDHCQACGDELPASWHGPGGYSGGAKWIGKDTDHPRFIRTCYNCTLDKHVK